MNEPVSKQDVERLSEDVLALWKTQYEFWQRTGAQGAPVSLQNEMAQINELLKLAFERLTKVTPYFPEQ